MTEEDYPRTLIELERRFATEEACRAYLFALRWPQGFTCAGCGSDTYWQDRRGRVICTRCQRQRSVTAGTIFQDSRTPLVLWFRAVWWVTSQKNGASALGLQRVLGLGSYETAWTWLHKLRRAMVRPGRDRLSGRVEVDETYVGGEEEGVHGRETYKKALVVIAAEEDGEGIGRIRMRRVPDASGKNLIPFVRDAVEPGSTIHTDDWKAYGGLKKAGYKHKITTLSRRKKKGKSASQLLPRVHRAASLLQRWILGTHQGAPSPDHLDYYLDEFVFRFNRRTSAHRGKLFYRLLQNAVVVEPAPYASLVKHVRGPRSKQHNR